jgi:hypothetical protein
MAITAEVGCSAGCHGIGIAIWFGILKRTSGLGRFISGCPLPCLLLAALEIFAQCRREPRLARGALAGFAALGRYGHGSNPKHAAGCTAIPMVRPAARLRGHGPYGKDRPRNLIYFAARTAVGGIIWA